MRCRWIVVIGISALVSCATPPPAEEVPADAPRSLASVELDDGTPTPGLRSLQQIRREHRLDQIDIGPARDAAHETVHRAIRSSGKRAVGWWGDLPEQPAYSRLLDPERTPEGSLSIGTVSNGTVRRPVELETTGPHHSIIERHRSRDTEWGTEEMIDLLEHAAAEVADHHPESTLRVGNIGRRWGGDIPWSSSHNSGRDADLAFYCESAETGKPVEAPDLVQFDSDGEAIDRPGLVFDVERNWTLVESLLTHPRVDLQWLFISRALKEKLLAHARSQERPERVIERASEVLHQPSDAPPHADHLHVRITCPEQDRLEGCLDFGPRWDWVDWHRRALLARSLELGRAIRRGTAETQLAALEFLRKIRSPFAPEIALAYGMDAEDREVRTAALDLASDIPAWSGAAVAESIALIESPAYGFEVEKVAYEILRRTHTNRGRRFALSQLLADDVPMRERIHAARALKHVMEPGLVPTLIDELDEHRAPVRAEIAAVLRRITGHRLRESWRSLDRGELEVAVRDWREWWNRHKRETRLGWLRRSFTEHGFDAGTLEGMEAVDELIPLLRESPDHVAYNANRLLHRVTGRWSPPENWSYDRMYHYWLGWWRNAHPEKVATR